MDLIYKDPDNIRNNKCIDSKPVANPLDEMKNNQVELRKARKEDAGFIAHVVMVAMGYNVFDKEVAVNGTSPLGKLSDILAALTDICAREDTLYSYKNTDIALFGGQVAGALVSYNGGDYKELAGRTFSLVAKSLGIPEMEPGTETREGEYYLDSMAVLPEFRGHGIGKILMNNALESAEALGFTKVTLLVDVVKPWLHKLYESVGFEKGEQVMFFGEPFMRMIQHIG